MHGAVARAEPPTHAAVVQAVERGVPYLDRDGRAWMAGELPVQGGSACVSCHQVPFGVWSQHEAVRAGIDLRAQGRRGLTEDAVAFVSDDDVARPVTLAVLMIGLGDAVEDPPWRETIFEWSDFIGGMQRADGFWRARGQFPSQRRPEAESDAVATMWMIYGLSQRSALPDGLRRRRNRALRWLRGTEAGVSTEWWAWRLVVAHVFGLPESRWRREVWGRQHQDGGWSFLADGRSDPYTTGEVIYALQCAGVTADDPRLSRAIDWLLSRQREDGTWTTPSLSVTTAPGERNDAIYRYWGTAWAVIGLASVADDAHLR